MRWRNAPSHKLVRRDDVRRLTGIAPEEVLRLSDTQRLVRVTVDGAREEMLRIPVSLLRDEAGQPVPDADGD